MERDHREEQPHSSGGSHIRRRRRVGRPVREKTPDASHYQRSSEEESSLLEATTASEDYAPQLVSMQIRPPQRTLSAHESKILRRRDKTFATAAARSLSQPREAERLSEPEATQLIRTVVKRSLSMPRNKNAEPNETKTATRERTLSPDSSQLQPQPVQSTADENLSRLEQNLRRFEQERKRFESEKRLFDREKRDHKVRYKQMLDNEERKRLLQSYRKLSERIKMAQDAEEKRRLVHSFKMERAEAAMPTARVSDKRKRLSSGYEESSTQFSSSEAEMEEVIRTKVAAKHVPDSSTGTSSSSALATASVRGPPPQPPARKSVSRNNSLSPVRSSEVLKEPMRTASRNNSLSPPRNLSRKSSLSPIRPERRSKTPEGRAEIVRRASEREIKQREMRMQQADTTATEMESEKETKLRHRKVRRHEASQREDQRRHDSLLREDQRRKHSVEEVDRQKRKLSLETADKVRRKQSLEREDKVLSRDRVDSSRAQVLPKEAHEVVVEVAKADNAKQVTEAKPSLLRRFFGFFRGSKPKRLDNVRTEQEELLQPKKPVEPEPAAEPEVEAEIPDGASTKVLLKLFWADARRQWRQMKADHPQELKDMRRMRNKCFAHTIMLILLVGFGGLMFRYTEGTSEDIYKCEVRKVKRDFVDNLWTNSHNMREDDWKTLARQKLRKFEEELHTMGAMGIRYFPGQRSWNFVNCILYCWTVITTIGYGHITPKTRLGQSLTIIYAIIGIPMFLILLADFGKLFTRAIKFLWGYVRRLYYTGTCRKFRKTQQMRDAMTGVSMVYDVAIRRPSMFFGITHDHDVESQMSEPGRSMANSHPETPTSPYPDTIVVDDEFNLPISLASILLITYILVGASVYTLWEDWTYFEAFYFVFISMSTIGFGDLVPNHPIFMMCSIIYLVFGLALTSMFINVVQIKLSDTFKDASAKIGATMGFGEASELGENESQLKTPSDLASVHGSRLDKITEDESEASPPARPLTSILRNNRSATANDSHDEQASDIEVGPPPLMPRRQVSMEQPPEEKKKKRRFFK